VLGCACLGLMWWTEGRGRVWLLAVAGRWAEKAAESCREGM